MGQNMAVHMRFWLFAAIIIISGAAFGELEVPDPLNSVLVTKDNTGQESYVQAYGAKMGDQPGIAIEFEGTDDLHFYANPETAIAPDLVLRATAASGAIEFADGIYPEVEYFRDPALNKEVEVWIGDFVIFIPFADGSQDEAGPEGSAQVNAVVRVTGIACTSMVCLQPFEHELSVTLDMQNIDTWPIVEIKGAGTFNSGSDNKESGAAVPQEGLLRYGISGALVLAFVAGLLINVMPCVWPVIPIIVTRIWQSAGEKRGRALSSGLLFCLGILLFFAAIAVFNIVLQVGFETVFQWGDLLRNQGFVAFMVLLMLGLGLFMFGVFVIGIPSSVTAKAGSGGSGAAGLIGMGFIAGLLGTPCSFGILAAVVAWAQTQTLVTATIVIMTLGVGMAAPYLALTSIPGLTNRLPRPGGWMEKVKIAMGFVLIGIGIKLAGALEAGLLIDVLYFGLVMSFALWMWGQWVGFGTPAAKKWIIRGISLFLMLIAGWYLFSPEQKYMDWQEYDSSEIEAALEDGRPVLIKFTAEWCANCAVVKKRVFEQGDVAELIRDKQVFAVEGDTTRKDQPATAALQQVYREPGIPVTILLTPDGQEHRLRGIFDKGRLVEILEEL